MRTLNDYFLTGTIDDVSTAFTSRIAVPDGGRVIKIITVLGGTISGANAGITAKVGTTAMTGGTITVAYSGSAAGDVDTCEPTGANNVEQDGYIGIATDGASTGTHSLHYTIIIRR
jgi:hypothetical protein